MNTHDIEIELPPLPSGYPTYEFPDGAYDSEQMHQYARAAIEADRKQRSFTKPSTNQDWLSLDPAVAFHLIERHAENWNDAGAMMQAYLDAHIEADRKRRVEDQEPFGYFRPEPFGWTDCAATDDGAIALYESPQAQGEPVAWISRVKCVGPEYGKEYFGRLPVQSLNPLFYEHVPLYSAPQPAEPVKTDPVGYTLGPISDGGMDPSNGPAESDGLARAKELLGLPHVPQRLHLGNGLYVLGSSEAIGFVKQLAEPVKAPSDADIDAVFNNMPDGVNGWLKSWGYRQFARAILARYGQPCPHCDPVDGKYGPRVQAAWHAGWEAAQEARDYAKAVPDALIPTAPVKVPSDANEKAREALWEAYETLRALEKEIVLDVNQISGPAAASFAANRVRTLLERYTTTKEQP